MLIETESFAAALLEVPSGTAENLVSNVTHHDLADILAHLALERMHQTIHSKGVYLEATLLMLKVLEGEKPSEKATQRPSSLDNAGPISIAGSKRKNSTVPSASAAKRTRLAAQVAAAASQRHTQYPNSPNSNITRSTVTPKPSFWGGGQFIATQLNRARYSRSPRDQIESSQHLQCTQKDNTHPFAPRPAATPNDGFVAPVVPMPGDIKDTTLVRPELPIFLCAS